MSRIPAKNSLLLLAYLASFFYSFHYALPLYIQSSFLFKFTPTQDAVGMVFAVGALAVIIATIAFSRLLKRFGNYRMIRTSIIVQIILLAILATNKNPFIILPTFILSQVFLNIIYLNLNAFVESLSANTKTGGIRGIFLTVINIAVVVAPLLGGLLLTDHDFEKIYLMAIVFLACVYTIISFNFRKYKDPVYETPSIIETVRRIGQSHDLHSIIFIVFLLNLFYAWMVIYTPIYLNVTMGIPMSAILTTIIPIALIPFVIFQIILGKIADKKLGETEILAVGFILLAVSTAMLSSITTGSVALWAGALFITRVGASAIEVMAESYLYKKVDSRDMHIITFMFIVRTSAYIIGPLIGSIVLAYFDYRYLFLILGALMLLGTPYSLSIRDTK